MIPLAEPSLDGNEARYLQECISSTFVSSVGPFVDRFEEAVARDAGAKGAVAVSSGTSGLHLALIALGVGRDDLVCLPSFTFIASANAVAHCGAEPWLFDIDTDTWTLDARALRRGLEAETERHGGRLVHKPTGRRVAAVMPVHALGLPADMDPINGIAGDFGLPVIADAAAAIGAAYRGRPVGAADATLSVFSFNGNKTVTAGGGGAVTGDEGDLLDLVRHLSTTAREGADYHHDRVGFNYRMTNLSAAVGCAQMERLDQLVAAKRRIRRTYDDAFGAIPGVGLFPDPSWAESACWISGVTVDADRLPAAGELRRELRDQGIDARPFWKPIHLQPPFAKSPRGGLETCDGLWQRILTLPCSTGMTADQQAATIAALKKALHCAKSA